MISELVAGAAWVKPPGHGAAAALLGRAGLRGRGVCPRGGAADAPPALPPPPPPPPPPLPVLKAARITAASLVESAFLRWTTQMLPVIAEPCGGASSLAISWRRLDMRAGFWLRTISELLRESTRTCGAASVAAP